MANTRLTVVVRKDLQLPEGLLAAQTTHLAMEFIRQMVQTAVTSATESKVPYPQSASIDFNEIEKEWVLTPYISILGVECKEDLESVLGAAQQESLPVNTWIDTIPSPTWEGINMKALVGVAIGPADFDAIKVVTGGLKRY